MTTVIVNGQTVSLTSPDLGDFVIQNGGTLIVSAGGTAGNTIQNSGVVNGGAANGSAGFLVSGTISNGGTMEASGHNSLLNVFGTATISNSKLMQAVATGSGGFAQLNISGDVNNSGATISALAASGAQAFVNLSGFVSNTGGKVIASGAVGTATINIAHATISGGTVGGVGSGARIGEFGPGGSGEIEDATILSGTYIAAGGSGSLLTLSGDAIGNKVKIEGFNGGTALLSNVALGVSGTFTGGTLLADRGGEVIVHDPFSGVKFGSGTTVQALGNGFVAVSASSIGNILGNVAAIASGPTFMSAEVDLFGSGGVSNGAIISALAVGPGLQ